ncbi:MAG: efflux RND transporter permease subunit [Sporocytophaga sp.]|uniref:efflux RND transporter permease subunit n=1 Tax=Sporocytophaga sp. TaxID=2231183 RepID=UPI001B03B872|nr:efflux RND transporter permease subunit [Sporocytophaga sp.]MBO9701106.1 efflux RND transporter permease subunit [Sporocytophaga sp.]
MKEFKVSSWSIDNKTSIYVLTIIITLAGIFTYMALPKEQFPEIVFPQMYVSTLYPGASPKDIENLITKPIEKEVKAIAGVKKVTSSSIQDYSSVVVEFKTGVDVAEAKQKVKDAVDKAKPELPSPRPYEPDVIEVDVSQVPIMNVNVSGDIELDKLKKYADDLQDKIESIKGIRRVDIIGALEREIQINVDKMKMEAANVSMTDIKMAVSSENVNQSGGLLKMDGMKRTITIKGEYEDPKDLENLVIRSSSGAVVYLKDIADVVDGYEEKESYARLDGKNVITLNVIKMGGENLIEVSDQINSLIKELKETKYPKSVNITVTGEQADQTRVTLHDLINTIIIGFILVTVILMFFMGTTNAIFVAMSVPLSMFIAFMVMDGAGFTLNMIVLFGFLLALGIVVDDAIVVIENTHRVFDNGKVPIKQAAKMAAGEVFLPVLSGTLTTLAPFVPLLFWPGVIGEFMYYLPITLIVTLLASLLVAYIINPVFAVDFMKSHDEEHVKGHFTKGFKITTIVFAVIAIMCPALGSVGMMNLTITFYLLFLLNKFVLTGVIKNFQEKTWPAVQNKYENVLKWALHKKNPLWLLLGTIGMLFFSIFVFSVRTPKVVFFPESEPNFIYSYISLPVGTDQAYTDSITKVVEKRVFNVVGKNNPMVKSIISNVAVGAGDPNQPDLSVAPNKGKVTVAFVNFADRNGESSLAYLGKIREAVKGIPGAEITVEQEQGGPPTGKPINIEMSGDDYEKLISESEKLIKYLENSGIEGIEKLKSDVQKNKPEIVIEVDRQKANAEGLSTLTIGSEIRNAVFGTEISKFRDFEDDYPIQLRYNYAQRNDIEGLLNSRITYRDMNMGGIVRQVPLSSVAKIRFTDTYGGINRKNEKRLVTVYSNILTGYNGNEVVGKITKAIKDFKRAEGVSIDMTGEQEDQKETGAFLGFAGLAAIGLIFLILVTQFNSVSKPVIILSEILFSTIGVFLGFSIFKMDMSIVMTGVGIVALGGIVVRNGILLVEFTHYLEEQGYTTKEAAIQAGKTRMTPVLLTATATILGLIPLAVGLNIDFVTLFTEFNPHIFFGGDSVAFWGPLSWTMIFGLIFATFLTLILVPVMYLLVDKLKVKVGYKKKHSDHIYAGEIIDISETEENKALLK